MPSISLDAPQGSGDEVIHSLKLFHQPVLYLGDMGQPAEEGVMAELMNGTELVELCPIKASVYRWRPLLAGLKQEHGIQYATMGIML